VYGCTEYLFLFYSAIVYLVEQELIQNYTVTYLNNHLLNKHLDEHNSGADMQMFIIIRILFAFGRMMQLTVRYLAE